MTASQRVIHVPAKQDVAGVLRQRNVWPVDLPGLRTLLFVLEPGTMVRTAAQVAIRLPIVDNAKTGNLTAAGVWEVKIILPHAKTQIFLAAMLQLLVLATFTRLAQVVSIHKDVVGVKLVDLAQRLLEEPVNYPLSNLVLVVSNSTVNNAMQILADASGVKPQAPAFQKQTQQSAQFHTMDIVATNTV